MTPAITFLALLAGFAAAGNIQPTTDTKPLTLEDSKRLNEEHETIVGELAQAVDAIVAARKAYEAGPPGQATALQSWADTFAPAHRCIDRLDAVWNEHNTRAHATEVYSFTRAATAEISNPKGGNTLPQDLERFHRANDAMSSRQLKQLNRFWEEGNFLKDALQAFEAAKVRRQNERRTALAAGGAAFALLALTLTLAWRYSRAAPQPPVLPSAAPARAGPPPLPALIGGNIQVVRPIGRGGMGEVYEGFDTTLQRRVALKRLRPELVGSANDLSRLLNEARLVAALKHPNIVAIHSVEKEAGQVFLVFEFVDGPTLTTFISQKKQVRWPEALGIFQGACAALSAAHARNIVHRDLKPGNIMLDSKGTPKVMDFGIAHEAAFIVSRLTRSGAWGTPPYMSPEQELGEVNTGVDLFALNVCLYEMLTGELPFTGPNFLAQKRERVYIPVSQAVPALPKALDAFFATAFDPDPVKRFHDAATLSAAAGALI